MSSHHKSSPLEILRIFLRLGVTSFGGPVAHIGYFRNEFVERRKWMTDETYADLVALCQFLPGPASSQVGFAIGKLRGGLVGGLAAWFGFTMPSALLLIAFAYGVVAMGDISETGWLKGLKVAAVAVVAHAVWNMAIKLCPDRVRATVAMAGAIIVLGLPMASAQIVVILLGGLFGWLYYRNRVDSNKKKGDTPHHIEGSPHLSLAAFFILLVLLPLLAQLVPSHALAAFDSFYRSGSLVFGGGHVVLPLLQSEVVNPGWVTNDEFLAGYGAAQAVPGPLFTFSAYLGSVMHLAPNGWLGGLLCLIAIFLPSGLLVSGALPYWNKLRTTTAAQAALKGTNAAVVGLLLAALYNPVWTSGINSAPDFMLGLVAFTVLAFWKRSSWEVVILCALGGFLFLN